MNKAIYAAASLLLACMSVEASFNRGLLACNPRTQKRCGGKCVSFLTDERNCGDCGKRCGATFQCIGGGCKCPVSRPQECGIPSKCVNVKNDPRNCGVCGRVCPSGACAGGQCVPTGRCKVNQKLCAGRCVNFLADPANCGNCGKRCTGGSMCVSGGCSCPKSKPDICTGNVCTDKLTDSRNCGSCGNVCARGKKCRAGRCQ